MVFAQPTLPGRAESQQPAGVPLVEGGVERVGLPARVWLEEEQAVVELLGNTEAGQTNGRTARARSTAASVQVGEVVKPVS
jgi:hypothetical protein